MALKSNYDAGRVQRETQVQADSLYERILAAFIRAGENFVIQAREQVQDHALGTYEDQTTNLRNSIGYFIFHDGELIRENQIGSAVANKQEVQSLVLPKGFQLIGIAGMNYASYVESKGYNVITIQAETCFLNLQNYLEILEVTDKNYNAQIEEAFATGPENYEKGL